jgi:pentatricopeptide repeat protein
LESGGEGRERVDCPEWLFLTLPALLQRTEDAPYLVSLLLSPELALLNEQNQGLFIARAVQALLKVHHWVAVRETIDWVCGEKMEGRMRKTRSYARILTALAGHRSRAGSLAGPSRELLDPLVDQLRRTMLDRTIAKDLAVYWPLFDPSLIPKDPRDATNLLLEMEAHEIPIHTSLIHAVMRVYARAGESVGAGILYASIKEVRRRRDRREFKQTPIGVRWSELDGPSANMLADQGAMILAEPEVIEDPDEALDQIKNYDAVEDLEERPLTIPTRPPDSLPISQSNSIQLQSNNQLRPPPRTRINHIYRNTKLLSLADDLRQAFHYFDNLQRDAHNAVDINRLPDVATWTTLISISAKSASVSSRQLLSILRQYETAFDRRQLLPFDSPNYLSRPTTRMYTVVMNGLNKRHDPELTLSIWDKISDQGYAPDAWMMTSIMTAMIAKGEVLEAEAFLIRFALPLDKKARRLPRSGSRIRPDAITPPPNSRITFAKSIPIDIVPINLLLSAYNREGHYLSAWQLWLRMEDEFGVYADAATVSILLDTARYASAAAGRGFGPGTEGLILPGGEAKQGNFVNDYWSGKPAWRTMVEVVDTILKGNWPEVAKAVENPVETEGFWSGLSALRRRFHPSAVTDQPSGTPAEGSAPTFPKGTFSATLASDPPPRYPFIHPTPQLFRSFIQLLGYHSIPHSVIPVLAWMKALDSKPTRSTVGLALLYIGEGSLGDGQRERMRIWLVDWLGESAVPTEGEIAKLRRSGGSRIFTEKML